MLNGTNSLLGLAAALLLCVGTASADTIFSTDFDSGAIPEISGAGSIVSSQGFDGAVGDISGNILRNDAFGNPASSTNLNLTGIGAHTELTIEFDLLAIDSWDGSTNQGGVVPPDFFNVTLNGGSGFSETIDFAIYADGTISTSADATVLDFKTHRGWSGWEDSAYHVSITMAHSSSSASIAFFASGVGWQGGSDESWGMDNLTVSTGPVPEPGSLALLGLGGLGLLWVRRRRKSA